MRQYATEELVLGDLLHERAVSHSSRTFLKLRDGEQSYAEVNEMANRMARGFAERGVRQRDHVAIMMSNCADFLHVIFALAKLGAVAVPINTAYKGDILHHVLDSSDTTMLVVDASCLDQVAPVGGELANLRAVVVRSDGSPSDTAVRGLSKPVLWLRDLLAGGDEAPSVRVRHSDLQAIMFTSGTTGRSKGVMTTHALALICAQDSLRYLAYQPGETVYCPIPLFHAGALWDGVMAAFLLGSSVAIVERFSASRFWEDVRRFGANVAMGIFSMIPILLKQPPTPDDRNHPLRAFYLGKSALDEEFRARFGVRSVETYTSTEVGIGTGSPYGEWRVGSCGQVNRETHEVKIVDALDREVGPGEWGEIVVRPRRPFAMFTGYYNYPQFTVEAFRNLWFHTGDRAYRDADGYFHFVERIKDSIRRRGENISAFEVEHAVNQHESVLESAAFGVPSELEEDEVKISVVLRPGASVEPAELVAFCEERLPSFMVPRYVELVGELPKTPIGKISKQALKSQGDHGITAQTWDRVAANSSSTTRAG